MNVVLVGYRGTGKSAVGRLLAEQLGLRVVSLDAELQRRRARAFRRSSRKSAGRAFATWKNRSWPRLPRKTARCSIAAAA